MSDAEKIRLHARDRYVIPARSRKEVRFPICAGNVVHELDMSGKTPNVCQALKGRRFLEANNLRLVDVKGPKSGLSTTVVYTYEFVGGMPSPTQQERPWTRLRGALKDVFATMGGGEAYLHAERESFYPPEDGK